MKKAKVARCCARWGMTQEVGKSRATREGDESESKRSGLGPRTRRETGNVLDRKEQLPRKKKQKTQQKKK